MEIAKPNSNFTKESKIGSNTLKSVLKRWNENCRSELMIVSDECVDQGINELKLNPSRNTNYFVKERSSQLFYGRIR